jgi:Tol biopolymer transport system component
VNDERSTRLGRPDADLWIYDHQTKEPTLLVEADGYDGGPFFSPDDKWICYRSDRRGDNQLQLFAAELAFDESGRPTGIVREVALTDNKDVNWAPYWHPSGEYWIFTSSAYSHLNYEVLAIEFAPDKPLDKLKTFRVTDANGFDGLSVFSPDGRHMMWTSQRGAGASSQLWIARFHEEVARGQLLEAMPVISPVEIENSVPAEEADGS